MGKKLSTILLIFLAGITTSYQATPGDSLRFRDFRLLIIATADWAGQFKVDERGREGLAALYAYAAIRRERIQKEGGAMLFLHLGDLSGSKDEKSFKKKLLLPEVNIPHYMNFDVLSLSGQENQFLTRLRKEHWLRGVKALSYNFNPAQDSKKPWVKPYSFITRRDYNFYLSAIKGGKHRFFKAGKLKGFRKQYERNVAADLRILMLDAADEKETQTLFRLNKIKNPYHKIEFPLNTVVFHRSGGKNRYKTLQNGVPVCDISPRALCEIEFRFRGRNILGIKQQFKRVNGAKSPSGWYTPDRKLFNALHK